MPCEKAQSLRMRFKMDPLCLRFTSQFSTRRDQTKSYRFFDIFTSVLPPHTYFPPYTTMGQKPWLHSFSGTGFYAFFNGSPFRLLFSEKVCTQNILLNLLIFPCHFLVSKYNFIWIWQTIKRICQDWFIKFSVKAVVMHYCVYWQIYWIIL